MTANKERVVNDNELNGHIVICGWSETTKGLIEQIRADTAGRRRHIVLIDPNLDASPIDDPFLYFVKGDPTEYETLERAYVKSAETALILTDWSLPDPGLRDSKTALTTLAIESFAPQVYTVAELMRAESRRHLERAGVDEPICISEMSQRLLVHAAMNHGLSRFFTEVLSYGEGNEIYKVPLPSALINMNYREAVRLISDQCEAILLAIEREKEIYCNPLGDWELQENDALFVLAEDYPHDLEQFGEKPSRDDGQTSS
ncbi:MAG: TrkA family potassium uptake protein [Pirellulales bacterium]